MESVIARIGKAHGLRGEVTVQSYTDNPEARFVPGETYACEGLSGPPGSVAPTELTIATARNHNGTWLLSFEGLPDRTVAEALRGGRLVLDTDEDETDGWYEEELLGLPVFDPTGAQIGEVTGLEVGAAQDRLRVRLADGRSGLVPFVEALVPEIDVEARRVVLDAPDALFDLES